MYRTIVQLLIALSFSAFLFGQRPAESLATSSIKNFTISDLPDETQKEWNGREKAIANVRSLLVSQMLTEMLVSEEAKAQGILPEGLLALQKSKIADPTDAQIQAVYNANRETLENQRADKARREIIKFLRQGPEQAALKSFTDSLAAKYKVVNGKDINTPGLQPTDVIFTVNSKPVTSKDFQAKYKLAIYDVSADIYDRVMNDLEDAIYAALVAEEARAQNSDSTTVIAREVTNRLREFTDEERFAVQNAFLKRLYSKYKVNILIKEPPPLFQNISLDDDPSRGSSGAPVTVVMFSDFQCPGCSATHPILKKVLAEYADRVRFVVRDFPLISIHEHALLAAEAASAANAQGRFFDYIEILYAHQDTLGIDSLKKYAADLGLNVKQFELDLSSEKTATEIQKDIADGRSYGIYSTPSIFVNGVKVHRMSTDGFRAAIEAALKK